ncbi:hypothetical protein Tco_0331175 [Tanacetum coccineum]
MAALKFAETHNLVAFLSKPEESDGFEQIVDFLNANPINYALTINPTIYTSCIKQLWATAKTKIVNEERTDCLPTATIFEELTRMGYEKLSQKLTFYKAFFSPQWKFLIHTILQCLSAKTTAWNEFSSSMTSAIICLATNQKFNFFKYIFDNMVKNLEGGVKFLMYPRFVQVFMNQQLGDMSHHKKIFVTPSHTKKVFRNMKREGKGFSGRVTPLFQTTMVQAHEEMGEEPAADETENVESVPTHSNDPLLSGADSIKLNELMKLCTTLQSRVIALETTKINQALEIDSLKRRVKKLEKKANKRTHKLKRMYKVGISAKVISSDDEGLGDQKDASKQGRKIQNIDADEDITLENVHDVDMFGVYDLDGDEVFVETEEPVVNAATTTSLIPVSTADPVTTAGEVVTTASVKIPDELTLAQTLIEIKSAKPKAVTTAATTVTPASTRPKAKGIVFHDQEEQAPASTPIVSSSQSSQIKDKGKGIMVEEPKKMQKKDQVLFDKQEALRLQAQFDEEDKIARKKEEVNAALIAQWNDIQDKVETDYELAQRLQQEEQEELTIEEKSKLFVQLLDKRRKHFEAKRAEEKRNRPPTKGQQRSIMCTYLKNMAGWKPKDLKNKSFVTIQDLFDKAMKRVNTFVDMDTELLESGELDEKVEAKVDDAKEAEELKQSLEIVPDDGDDITVDATPLSVKIPIVNYKIHQEGKKRFFQIISVDGNSQIFKKTEPVNYMDTFLHLSLKTMFEHHVEDGVWKNQQGLVKVLNWKIFDSCGVHYVTMQSISYYLLVEKMYPLTNHTLHQMFNDVKLQVDYECGMTYELLRLVKKQLKEGYVRQ